MQFRIRSVLSLFEMICSRCFFWEWLCAWGRQKSGWRVAYRLVIDLDVVIQRKDNENIFPKAEWGNIMVTWDLQKSEQFWLPEKKFYDLQNWEKRIILWILPHWFFFLSELLLKLAKDNVIWYTAFEITLCCLAHALSRKAREILSNAVAIAISCFRHRTGSILMKQKTFKA